MTARYSKDGKFFAQLSTNGKLKIWETSTNSFIQEFTPDYHLTSPCTSLHFVDQNSSENDAPHKRRRKEPFNSTVPNIVLGTRSGKLLVYSIAKGALIYVIDGKTNLPINCVSWNNGAILYSGVEQNIVCWNLEKQIVKSKWKAGNEIIKSILALPENRVITGAKVIKLWNAVNQELLRSFTGHSHEVSILDYVHPREDDNTYIISGSKNDRLIHVWSLSDDPIEKNAIVYFLLDDVPSYISTITVDGATSLAVVTNSGKIHLYQHTLNGKCSKPLKAKTILQVVTQDQNDAIIPISVIAAYLTDPKSLLIVDETELAFNFSNVTVKDSEKLQVVVRDRRNSFKNKKGMKRLTSATDKVYYLTPHVASISKRKSVGGQEVPMAKRLENLTLNQLDSKSSIPFANNVAQLLIQGLHSKDKEMLRTVLNIEHEETIIKNTIKRLPIRALHSLIEELTTLVKGTTVPSQIGCAWLKNLVQIHSGILLSNPDVSMLLGAILGSMENRMMLLAPLSKLKGRLDMLVSRASQFSISSNENNEEDALLVFNDKITSESDSEVMNFPLQSESENEWIEASDEENNVIQVESDNDVEMV